MRASQHTRRGDSRIASTTAKLPRPGISYGNLIVLAIVLGATLASAYGTSFSLREFFSASSGHALQELLLGFFPPTVSPGYLAETARLSLQTVEISIVGTVLGMAIAIPLALLATRRRWEEEQPSHRWSWPWLAQRGLFTASRTILNVLRGVPELIWALLFIVVVGLGPTPGILALTAHAAGSLGKLYAETFEAVDLPLVDNVKGTGANAIQIFGYAIIPASLPVLVSHTLYRWECNMRSATIVGFVGAGGIGNQIINSLKLYQYRDLATLIITTIILVILVDLVSQFLRGRILDPRGRRVFIADSGEGQP